MLRHKYLCLLGLVALVAGCTSCGGGAGQTAPPPQASGSTAPDARRLVPGTPASARKIPDFNAALAFADLQKQCSFGARIPASTAHTQCLAWLKTQFPGADKQVNQNFSAKTPYGGPFAFTNVVALYGAAKPGVPFLICSHWDSRPKADHDPDPAKRDKPVMGANDGASGVGVILELARMMKDNPPPRPVLLALLDAEDSGKDGSTFNAYEGFCIGTEYLAKNWPTELPKPAEGALLDMVGRNDLPDPHVPNPGYGGYTYLNLPIEGNSLNTNPTLVNALWTIAEQRGRLAFKRQVGSYVIDDHMALIAGGIKCVDLIQFAPPEWHTTYDTPEYCSAAALLQSGDTLTQYLYQE